MSKDSRTPPRIDAVSLIDLKHRPQPKVMAEIFTSTQFAELVSKAAGVRSFRQFCRRVYQTWSIKDLQPLKIQLTDFYVYGRQIKRPNSEWLCLIVYRPQHLIKVFEKFSDLHLMDYIVCSFLYNSPHRLLTAKLRNIMVVVEMLQRLNEQGVQSESEFEAFNQKIRQYKHDITKHSNDPNVFNASSTMGRKSNKNRRRDQYKKSHKQNMTSPTAGMDYNHNSQYRDVNRIDLHQPYMKSDMDGLSPDTGVSNLSNVSDVWLPSDNRRTPQYLFASTTSDHPSSLDAFNPYLDQTVLGVRPAPEGVFAPGNTPTFRPTNPLLTSLPPNIPAMEDMDSVDAALMYAAGVKIAEVTGGQSPLTPTLPGPHTPGTNNVAGHTTPNALPTPDVAGNTRLKSIPHIAKAKEFVPKSTNEIIATRPPKMGSNHASATVNENWCPTTPFFNDIVSLRDNFEKYSGVTHELLKESMKRIQVHQNVSRNAGLSDEQYHKKYQEASALKESLIFALKSIQQRLNKQTLPYWNTSQMTPTTQADSKDPTQVEQMNLLQKWGSHSHRADQYLRTRQADVDFIVHVSDGFDLLGQLFVDFTKEDVFLNQHQGLFARIIGHMSKWIESDHAKEPELDGPGLNRSIQSRPTLPVGAEFEFVNLEEYLLNNPEAQKDYDQILTTLEGQPAQEAFKRLIESLSENAMGDEDGGRLVDCVPTDEKETEYSDEDRFPEADAIGELKTSYKSRRRDQPRRFYSTPDLTLMSRIRSVPTKPVNDDFVTSVKKKYKLSQVQNMMKTTLDWSFDSIKFDEQTDIAKNGLVYLGYHLIKKHQFDRAGVVSKSGIDVDKMIRFFYRVQDAYNSVPYHNSQHACDVMASVNWLFENAQIYKTREQFSPFYHFIMIVAASVHDVSHSGHNNDFHRQVNSPLVTDYNANSPLENYHLAFTFRLLARDECNFFPDLDEEQRNEARKVLSRTILSTDMEVHSRHDKQLDSLAEHAAKQRSRGVMKLTFDKEQRMQLLEAALHVADIGNGLKATAVCETWSKRVTEEFRLQGDEEKERWGKVVSKSGMFSRDTPLEKSQVGWFEHVLMPFVQRWVKLNPDLAFLEETGKKNLEYWKRYREKKA